LIWSVGASTSRDAQDAKADRELSGGGMIDAGHQAELQNDRGNGRNRAGSKGAPRDEERMNGMDR